MTNSSSLISNQTPSAAVAAHEISASRFYPTGTGFNHFAFLGEESFLSEMPGKIGRMGFNGPSDLFVGHAHEIAKLIGVAFSIVPEPDYIRMKVSDTRLGFMERINCALPESARVEFFKPSGELNLENTITLKEFGMLLGATYSPREPLVIVIGITAPFCGRRAQIESTVGDLLLRGITHYCETHDLGAPSSIKFMTQYDVMAEHLGLVGGSPLKVSSVLSDNQRWIEHLNLWIEPEGIEKIKKFLGRVLPNIQSVLSAEGGAGLYQGVTGLVTNYKVHESQRDSVRGIAITHKTLADLKLASGKLFAEVSRRLKGEGEKPNFYSHDETLESAGVAA